MHTPDADPLNAPDAAPRRRRVLVAYSIPSTYVQTTRDYLLALKDNSRFDVDFVHATFGALIDADFDAYDAVFNNYCVRHCFTQMPSPDYAEKLKRYRGVKVMAVQDEYNLTETLRKAIEEIGFDVVLTCVPQNQLDYVYPRERFPNTRFETVFTGYAPSEWTRALPYPRMADRPIALGYRGRDIGGQYGRLGYEKYEIGRRMKEICAAAGVAHDIAVDEDSRIYGEAWFDFIGSCRAMLGSESGSNIFDFDGEIERRFHEMTAKAGGVRPSYDEFRPFVEKRENEIDMGQISPRVFECAAMRTAMVLFRGRYSDALEPDLHYIALEKDFSNAAEVLARLEDIPALEAMTQRAYDHLIGSGRFGYRAFVARIDDLIEDAARARGVEAKASPPPTPAPGLRRWPTVAPTGRPLPAAAYYLGDLVAAIDAAGLEPNSRLFHEISAVQDILDPQAAAAVDRCKAATQRFERWSRLARPDVTADEIAAVPLAEAQNAVSEVWGAIAELGAIGVELAHGGLARHERGARVVSSSPFFPAPNDPAGLLGDDFDYAAALEGPPPHWFEIDLGAARMTQGAIGVFYDRAHRAVDFRISILPPNSRSWRVVAEARDSDLQIFARRWPPAPTRRIKFEALAFGGQPRLLMRRFSVLEAPGEPPPATLWSRIRGRLRARA